MTTWDAAFEAVPANSDDHSLGAGVIRTLKTAISERLELEHNFKAGTSPSHKAGLCAVMYKGTTSEINALASPIAGGIAWDTTLQVQKIYVTGTGWSRMSAIPSGTKMFFAQAAAPTGWTQVTTWNDRVIRVVDGTGVGGSTGGSWTISGISVDNHTLTLSEIPAHTHDYYYANLGALGFSAYSVASSGTSYSTSSAGGGSGHNHNLTIGSSWRPAYLDVICASKD